MDAVILTQYRRLLDELACRMSHPGSWAGIPRLLDQLYRLRREHERRADSALPERAGGAGRGINTLSH